MEEREQLELENYLREFGPRTPKELPLIEQRQYWRRLAAAIAIFFFGTVSFWGVWQHTDRKTSIAGESVKDTPPVASTISLTVLAFENPDQFASTLDAQTLQTLQKFDRKDSALRVLAKE